MSMELDALISQHVFGIPVLGNAMVHETSYGEYEIYPPEMKMDGAYLAPVRLACPSVSCKDDLHRELDQDLPSLAPVFGHHPECLCVVPKYSSDHHHAIMVVYAMAQKGHEFKATYNNRYLIDENWYVEFTKDYDTTGAADGQTFTEAVCKAALFALSPEPETVDFPKDVVPPSPPDEHSQVLVKLALWCLALGSLLAIAGFFSTFALRETLTSMDNRIKKLESK